MFYKAAPCLFIGRLEIEVRYKVENRDSGKPHSDVAGAGWGTGFSECCNEFGDEAIGACVTIFVGRIEYDRALELITDIWEFVQVLAWNLPDTMRMSVGIVHSAGCNGRHLPLSLVYPIWNVSPFLRAYASYPSSNAYALHTLLDTFYLLPIL